MAMLTLNHSPVHSDPEICGGTLVFRGTRVFAQTLLDYINKDNGLDVFLDNFPSVDPHDAREFLKLVCEKDHF